MGFVLRHFIDDVAVTLKQTFDDKMIQRSQIAYWTLLCGNTLKSQHILKRSSGAFLTSFNPVPVSVDSVTGRKYFVLPKTIYDFNNDRGIDCIAYVSDGSPMCPPQFTRQTMTRTTKKISERLYYSRHETPSPKNPFFYRISDKIYLLGIEKVDIKFLEVDLFTAFDPLTQIDIDQYFDFPDELFSILRRNVMDLAKYSYLFPQERANDGNDGVADKQTNLPKTTSVNDQLQAEQ
jgi:hypothetical protein